MRTIARHGFARLGLSCTGQFARTPAWHGSISKRLFATGLTWRLSSRTSLLSTQLNQRQLANQLVIYRGQVSVSHIWGQLSHIQGVLSHIWGSLSRIALICPTLIRTYSHPLGSFGSAWVFIGRLSKTVSMPCLMDARWTLDGH